jgi:hypothetical protein
LGRSRKTRATGRFLTELAGAYFAGVLGFFRANDSRRRYGVGRADRLRIGPLPHDRGVRIGMAAHPQLPCRQSDYAYTAGTFALISVLFFLKNKLVG